MVTAASYRSRDRTAANRSRRWSGNRPGTVFALLLAAIATPAFAVSELHTFHCLWGCPLGTPDTDDIVVREVYTLASNDITKLADWVAYRVTPAGIGPSEDRKWQTDIWLGPDETLKPSDYNGAPTALKIDRGHQAPLASMSGTAFGAETNILSNITPQSAALNQGPWVRLETAERDLARSKNIAVYVYTGPLFERMMRPLPNGPAMHRVPSGYWKVIATEDGRISSFIFDQAASRALNLCDARVPLAHLQLRAKLKLFPRTDATKLKSLDDQLGCLSPPPTLPAASEIP